MDYFIIILVCFFSSAAGAICGIGGGVIIKPVLDAAGIMPVTTISFLSGCTVLSMALVSLYKSLQVPGEYEFDHIFASVLAFGSVTGGILGKELYQGIINNLTDTSRVGSIQAAVLTILTLGTLIYTLNKGNFPTKHLESRAAGFLMGGVLGMLSSFLGIGGGPINLVALSYLFSMAAKQAAVYSIYIILFSQVSSLLYSFFRGTVPDFDFPILILMMTCGILGGYTGSRLNRLLDNPTVDKLFTGLMGVIICICCYNVFRYL